MSKLLAAHHRLKIGKHCKDQILLPLRLARGGGEDCAEKSRWSHTQAGESSLQTQTERHHTDKLTEWNTEADLGHAEAEGHAGCGGEVFLLGACNRQGPPEERRQLDGWSTAHRRAHGGREGESNWAAVGAEPAWPV